MQRVLDPFRFVVIAVAGWMNQRQLQMIEYLREENRVLREQLGERRLRITDDQRRRLAAKVKGLARKLLAEVATIVTAETLLRWPSGSSRRNTTAAESAARAVLPRPLRLND
jgi:putative transposase